MWVVLALATLAGATSASKHKIHTCHPLTRPSIPASSRPVKCGPNAYWEHCPPQCPSHQNCSILWSKDKCVTDEDYCCKPACRCKKGYYRNKNFECISLQQCQSSNPEYCGPNAFWDHCPPQCPSHQNCSLLWCEHKCVPDKDYCCEPACRCRRGFYRDKNFECVASHQCLATCRPQKETEIIVNETQEEKNQCPANETTAWCVIDCPYKYCPISDSLTNDRCPPKKNCTCGCVCQWNYKRLSFTDRRCILASDCPPVKCTRPNEEWNSCPSPCFRENCEDRNITTKICHYEGLHTCEPRCVCIDRYFRDQFGYCVTWDECANSTFTID